MRCRAHPETVLRMIDKRVQTIDEALNGISDGASIMVAGFDAAGQPNALIRGMRSTCSRWFLHFSRIGKKCALIAMPMVYQLGQVWPGSEKCDEVICRCGARNALRQPIVVGTNDKF